MADKRGLPVLHAGEVLRRIIAARRQRRRCFAIAALIICTAAPLAASALWKAPVLLVWNASASAPMGLYGVRADGPIRRGDMVVAWIPEPARSLAARRRYLPANVPLVKRVAAVAGDRICAIGSRISINGKRTATRQRSDAERRPIPWWKGCRRLIRGEYFLLMESPLSFDGRYFGVTRRSDVIGEAELLWAR